MDRNDFRQVLRKHGDQVYAYAVRLLGNREDASEVVQEGLMRLWTSRSTVTDGLGRNWLMRTVHHLCMDRFRRHAVRRETALENAYDQGDRRTPRADRAAELSELQSALVRALADMPPRDRALIVLREMQGMSYQEMAHVLELSVNTLKPALHRARERLRQQLARAGVRP